MAAPPVATPAAAPAPTAHKSTDNGDSILIEIQAIGEHIRKLKADKADKVDNFKTIIVYKYFLFKGTVDAEVAKLLDAKKRFTAITGKEWNAKLIDAVVSQKVLNIQNINLNMNFDFRPQRLRL